jgi:gliding motility-associated-like protein
MRQFLQKLIITASLLLTGHTMDAAHLVGGEITYTCLGSNSYQITLRIYRDCNSGGAGFDNSVNFSVYDISGNLLFNPSVTKGPTITVPTGTGNPCLTIPPNICTEYAEYVHTMTLPARIGGYTISYQRCCRNSTITNISASGKGNTYTVQVPTMDNCNSTPQFTTIPPIVICQGDQLSIDASATDANGDSLHYTFCDILNGGSSFNASPNPADPPPYSIIPFIAPNTSAVPIPGNPALSIDPITGMITGVANQTGQFVVGICVSEYDNGVLKSTVRRDYQFNVTNCIVNVVADMLTQVEDPTMLCGGTTVQFQAQTAGALGYMWNFGDTTSVTDTSSSPTPLFTFPDTGRFDVMLIINPGLVCTDTVIETFVIYDSPDYQIGWSGVACFEAQDFTFKAIGTTPVDATFSWDFGTQSNTFGATGDSIEHVTWNQPGKHWVKMTVHSVSCPDTLYDTVEVFAWTLDVSAGSDTAIVYGDTAYLAVDTGAAWYWYADQPVYWNNYRQQDPQMWMLEDSTTVYVIVTDILGCRGADTLMVYWLPRQTRPELGHIQNLMTPNGDGLNDILDLSEVTFGDDCTLRVFDRWGGQVYEQTAYDDSWTGVNANGRKLGDGTYYIMLQCGLKEIRYAGPLTLVRP